jgi:hypothetical protein
VVEPDFDGSLRVARELHGLSTWLEDSLVERSGAVEDALAAWRGPFADELRVQAETDDQETRNLVAGLQVVAHEWAQGWTDAMNEQNRRNRQRAVEELSAVRGWGERAVDVVIGDDSDEVVAELRVLVRPRSPDFVPTGSLQRF